MHAGMGTGHRSGLARRGLPRDRDSGVGPRDNVVAALLRAAVGHIDDEHDRIGVRSGALQRPCVHEHGAAAEARQILRELEVDDVAPTWQHEREQTEEVRGVPAGQGEQRAIAR